METSPRYKPNVTVACIVQCDDKFLIVEEWIDGEQRFNQPAGHLEANESLLDACLREVVEETGLTIELDGLVGIYQFTASESLAFLRFTFACRLPSTSLPALNPQDPAITKAHWFTLAQIQARSSQLRSPLVLSCIEDYLTGTLTPTALISDQYL